MEQPIKLSLAGTIPLSEGLPRAVASISSTTFAIGDTSGALQVWEYDTNSRNYTCKIAQNPHSAAIYNIYPRGNTLYTVSGDRRIISSDVQTLSMINTYNKHQQSVGSLALLPIEESIKHSQIVASIVNEGGDIDVCTLSSFISGSWDGTLHVWNQVSVTQTISTFQYSVQVCYCPNTNQVIVGSGDKNIVIYDLQWSEETSQAQLIEKHKIIKAHEHVIRKLIPHPLGFISAGNDGFLTLWSSTGVKILTTKVYFPTEKNSEFIHDLIDLTYITPEDQSKVDVGGVGGVGGFDINKLYSRYYAVCGDDDTVNLIYLDARLENNNTDNIAKDLSGSFKVISSITMPKTAMNLTLIPLATTIPTNMSTSTSAGTEMSDNDSTSTTPNNPIDVDIYCATAAGVYRLTTSNLPNRLARVEDVEAFTTLQHKIEEKRLNTKIDPTKYPDLTVLLQPGNKDGAIQTVNQDGKAMVYRWSFEQFEWVLAGEMLSQTIPDDEVDENGEVKKKKTPFNGLEYDHVVPVDIDPNLPPLQLPFNKDDDPSDIAHNFIAQYGLPIDYLGEIMNFIKPLMDPAAREKRLALEQEREQREMIYYVPIWNERGSGYIKHVNFKSKLMFDAIMKRATQLQFTRLVQNGVNDLHGIIKTVETVGFVEPTPLPPSSLELLLQLLRWPVGHLAPVLDILRLLLCNTNINQILLQPTSMDSNFQTVSFALHSTLTNYVPAVSSNGGGSVSPVTPVTPAPGATPASPTTTDVTKSTMGGVCLAIQCLTNWIAMRPLSNMESRSYNNGNSIIEPMIIPFLSLMMQSIATVSKQGPIRIMDESIKFYYNLVLWIGRLQGMENNPLFHTILEHLFEIFIPYLINDGSSASPPTTTTTTTTMITAIPSNISNETLFRWLGTLLSCINVSSVLRSVVLRNSQYCNVITSITTICNQNTQPMALQLIAQDAKKILKL